MSFDYRSPPSVAQLKAKAAKSTAKLQKKGVALSPLIIEGRTIAKSWWGKAWLDNLQSYADYWNRLTRGRSYALNGMVLDLRISANKIEAIVQGSRVAPYDVLVVINALPDKRLESIGQFCAQRIALLDDLLSGAFPADLAEIFADRKMGLFPSPNEIHFACNCPDYADMCKHVAAVLNGVGKRLDEHPDLFFVMRGIPIDRLLRSSVDQRMDKMMQAASTKSSRMISPQDINELFGEIDTQ